MKRAHGAAERVEQSAPGLDDYVVWKLLELGFERERRKLVGEGVGHSGVSMIEEAAGIGWSVGAELARSRDWKHSGEVAAKATAVRANPLGDHFTVAAAPAWAATGGETGGGVVTPRCSRRIRRTSRIASGARCTP